MTFVWFAGMLAGRFALRPMILPIGKRWGLKPLVIAGVLLNAVQFPTYAAVHGLGWPLLPNGALGAGNASTGPPTTPILRLSATPSTAATRSASAKRSPL